MWVHNATMTSSVTEHAGPRYHGLPVTREQYLDLPDDDYSYDMVQGVLFVAPSAEPEHGRVQVRFASVLDQHLRRHPVGVAMVEVDVLFPDGGDVLRPDVSFVLEERRSVLLKHIHGAPDLVAEVLSDSTADRDLSTKAGRYLANGVREYWIVDPRNRTVQLWLNRKTHWEKRSVRILQSEMLPGFEIDQAEFW